MAPALFLSALWDVRARMAHGYARASNAVEGARNSSANHIVDGAHPKLWPLIDGLKCQQALANRELAARVAKHIRRPYGTIG